jgi:H+/Cl- antiporter ClcA
VRASERRRVPRPLIPHRIPSKRAATEQPNATGDRDAPLTPTVWLLVGLTGVAAGLFGAALMALLHLVEWLAFGYHSGSFEAAVERSSSERRLAALAAAGLFAGLAWSWLRRAMFGKSAHLDDELWSGTANLSIRRSLLSSAFSEVVVGAGASLGKEAAPKLMGAACASLLARWQGLSVAQRRLLVACGGGAGMAAVYNVPLGGTLIAAELLYGSLSLPVILPALGCSWIATCVSWIYLPVAPTYPHVPAYPLHASHVVFALVVGPVIGVLSVAWVRLIGWVSYHQMRGRALAVSPLVAFTLLGVVAIKYPQLLGNGQDVAARAFLAPGSSGVGLLVALAVLKPLATSLCLGSGATGGLFTPTLSTGAALGAVLGIGWSHVWAGSPTGSYALIGAAAMIGASMQTPLAALALVIELTHTADTLIVALIAATMLATAVSRYLDGYSIYSSRLPAQSPLNH